MISAEGSVVSHLAEIKIRIENIASVMVNAAAETLAGQYRAELTRRVSPPHSRAGSVPHAYDGPRPGGYDNTGGRPVKNNRPETGFAREQEDFLANYIETNGGQIGFRLDGHVANRTQNYLLWHDQNGRPWVRRIFFRQRGPGSQIAKKMIAAARAAKREFLAGGGADVPF
jgi:hypothetical protein